MTEDVRIPKKGVWPYPGVGHWADAATAVVWQYLSGRYDWRTLNHYAETAPRFCDWVRRALEDSGIGDMTLQAASLPAIEAYLHEVREGERGRQDDPMATFAKSLESSLKGMAKKNYKGFWAQVPEEVRREHGVSL